MKFIMFNPSTALFDEVKQRCGTFPAEFPRGPNNARVKTVIKYPMFDGLTSDFTSFLTSVKQINRKCRSVNWNGPHRFNTLEDIIVRPSKAARAWDNARDNVNNETNATFLEAVKEMITTLSNQANPGDQAYDALRSERHVNHLSTNYVNQLIEFPELYQALVNYVDLCRLMETNAALPANDSHELKVLFVGMLDDHTKRWLENNARNPTNNNKIRLMENDGLTAEQIAELADPYYNMYLMWEGARIPKQSVPRLITGNSNGNNDKEDGNGDANSNGGDSKKRVRFNSNNNQGGFRQQQQQGDGQRDSNSNGGRGFSKYNIDPNQGGCPLHTHPKTKKSNHLYAECTANPDTSNNNFKRFTCVKVLERPNVAEKFPFLWKHAKNTAILTTEKCKRRRAAPTKPNSNSTSSPSH